MDHVINVNKYVVAVSQESGQEVAEALLPFVHKVRFLTREPLLLSMSSTDTLDDLLGAIAKHTEYAKAAVFETCQELCNVLARV